MWATCNRQRAHVLYKWHVKGHWPFGRHFFFLRIYLSSNLLAFTCSCSTSSLLIHCVLSYHVTPVKCLGLSPASQVDPTHLSFVSTQQHLCPALLKRAPRAWAQVSGTGPCTPPQHPHEASVTHIFFEWWLNTS